MQENVCFFYVAVKYASTGVTKEIQACLRSYAQSSLTAKIDCVLVHMLTLIYTNNWQVCGGISAHSGLSRQ